MATSPPADAVVVERAEFTREAVTVSMRVRDRPFVFRVQSRSPLRRPRHPGDAWLPLALLPAMREHLPLWIADPVSATLARNVPLIQSMYATWYPELGVVPVEAPVARERLARRRRASLQLFTGGVDSFATLADHPEMDTLVYMHDLVHDVPEVRRRIGPLLDSAAAATGRGIIQLSSDVRGMLDQYAEWGTQTHGPVLAAMAALVSPEPADFFMPASHTYRELGIIRGAHAVMDHLWGSANRRLVHDGAHRDRTDKIRLITREPAALRHLRVCWQTTTAINCSRCEKCVRTMTSLELLGVLPQAVTFEGSITAERILAMELTGASDSSFVEDNLRLARECGRQDLAAALQTLLERSAALRP